MSFWDLKPKVRTSCSSCGYEDTECVDTPPPLGGKDGREPLHLCEVCYNTSLGAPALYPNQFDQNHTDVCMGIAWGINRILDEIRRTSGNRT